MWKNRFSQFMYWPCYSASLPIIGFLLWAKNIHPILVLILPEWGPFQLRFISHLGQPSSFHCGKIDFQSLCTGPAILPPPPIIRFLLWAKNIHPILVLILPEWGPFQLRFISHLGQPRSFHCGKIDFQN